MTIYVRNGKQLVGITREGKVLLDKFQNIMNLVSEVKDISKDFETEDSSLVEFSTLACA